MIEKIQEWLERFLKVDRIGVTSTVGSNIGDMVEQRLER